MQNWKGKLERNKKEAVERRREKNDRTQDVKREDINKRYQLTKNEKNRAVADRKCQMSCSSKKSSRTHSRFFSRDSAGVPWKKVRMDVGDMKC